jgi:primosomal protein N' (replication factor Y)
MNLIPGLQAEARVSVLVPVAVAAPYTYRVPGGMAVAPGDIVEVPLGTRDVVGVVWDDPADGTVGHNRLRPITEKFDAPPLSAEIRGFVDWVANYTLTARGMVLRMVLRAPGALMPEAPVAGVRFTGRTPERMTAARQRVLEHCRDGRAWSKSGLAGVSGVSPGVVQGLVEAGALEIVAMPASALGLEPDPAHGAVALAGEQEGAAGELRAAVDAGAYSVTLLDGVTGSGKTEVYFEAVAATLKKGKQVLILLPEIALTADFLDRFALRFGASPAEWHSEVAPRLRERVWRNVSLGTTLPTSRRSGSSTTPATWRWSGRIAPASRWCSHRRRPRSNRGSTRKPDATGGSCFPAATRRRRCRRSRRSTCGETSRSAGASCRRRW